MLRQNSLAWSVHLLTATGIVWSLLAIEAAVRADWRGAFAWLFVAVIVDAVDGSLARLVGVKEVLPNFNGTLLDTIIDYVSYVVVPAFILMRTELLEPAVGFAAAAAICLASAYQFCQADAKTADHTFKGFPSYWNIAVLYLLAIDPGPVWNAAVVGTLIALVFVPIKYLYPTRTPRFRRLTIALTIAWGITVGVIVWQLPTPSTAVVYWSMSYFAYYVGMSIPLNLNPNHNHNLNPRRPSQ